MNNGKKRMIKPVILGVIATILVLVAAFGLFIPVNIHSPIGLVLLRPELRGIGTNLLIGNPHFVVNTPLMLGLGQRAWNAGSIAYGLNSLINNAKAGNSIYYPVSNDGRTELGLYCLHSGEVEKKPYVILFAGGGYTSVCTIPESLPVAAAFNELGYTVFLGNYTMSDTFGIVADPVKMADDIAMQIKYITDHANELNVETDGYLIGGFSAGAVTVSDWCDPTIGYHVHNLPKPGAVCYIYGVNSDIIDNLDVPAFLRFCVGDQYFDEELPKRLNDTLISKGIPTDYKMVHCLHGFGLGAGTEAEGWVDEAVAFWKGVR